MKNREELAKHFAELGFKKIAEVGVFDGHYAEMICKNVPGVKLYAIDCWAIYPGYRDRKFQSSMDKAYALTLERLAPYDAEIIKKFSVDAVKDFEDESLDAVFIDGNHRYEFVKEDLELWAPKVRSGGIVSLHDYYITPRGNVGVIKAVDEFIAKNNYKLELTEWDYSQPFEDDRQPCAYFTKL